MARKTQIGQVEIIGAIAAYLSIPELAGLDIIHWIDNQSACAALTKGYSGKPDSARLVHAFHAWAAGSKSVVWFEYIPTDQNIADRPSRDISLAHCAYEVLPGIVSYPVRVVFPVVSDFADPKGWMREWRVARRACAAQAVSDPPRSVRARLV